MLTGSSPVRMSDDAALLTVAWVGSPPGGLLNTSLRPAPSRVSCATLLSASSIPCARGAAGGASPSPTTWTAAGVVGAASFDPAASTGVAGTGAGAWRTVTSGVTPGATTSGDCSLVATSPGG